MFSFKRDPVKVLAILLNLKVYTTSTHNFCDEIMTSMVQLEDKKWLFLESIDQYTPLGSTSAKIKSQTASH